MRRALGNLLAGRPSDTHARLSETTIARVFTIGLGVLPLNGLVVNYQFASLVTLSSLLIVDATQVVLAGLLVRYGLLVLKAYGRGSPTDAHWGQALTCFYAGAVVFVQFSVFSQVHGYWHDVILAYQAGIAISAGLVLSPLLVGAVGYTLLAGAGVVLTSAIRFGGAQPQLPVLLAAYAVFMAVGCVYLNALYRRFIQSEGNILAKNEIIGILLHDFEENSRDIMWQTDLRGDQVSLPAHEDEPQQGRPFFHGLNLRTWMTAGAAQPGPARDDFLKLAAAMASLRSFRDLVLPIAAEARWVRISGKPVFDPNGVFTGYRGIASDVTVARQSEERIAHMARHDGLTDLPNRVLLQEQLAAICAEARPFALIFLDLDGFKGVNDTHGHQAGDDLLRTVAARLSACIGPGDIVARLGGDEFVVLKLGREGSAEDLAERILTRLGAPVMLQDVEINIGASVGIACSPRDGDRPADILKRADMALYLAKAEGRGHWRVFDAAMLDRGAARHALLADLRRAMARQHLDLAYQPIIDLETERVEVVEALLRWTDPERGSISPSDFIPLAEGAGLIVEIGAWALKKACVAAESWPGAVRVAVNFSPLQLRDPGLLAVIDSALEMSGLAPERLEIEITESLFLDATPLALDHLRRLRERGIRVALDDFGTGYSSLSYLRAFPFDKVKIDRSFVRDLGTQEEARVIVRAITAMASSLGLKTTAEGVETQTQMDVLRASGCTQAQGYLLGRPCAGAAIPSAIMARNGDESPESLRLAG
jgi:diguanylate cyclase (GGDEF)-like protein